MEAEDGFQPSKTVAWKGDWDLYKRQFRAAARLSGMEHAIKLAERLAKGGDLKALIKEDENMAQKALAQSSMLQARLVLGLISTVGPQQALLGSGDEEDDDGIATWARLVKHFEFITKGLRARELHAQWARERLQSGEHPALLHARLVSIQRRMTRLDEILTDNNLVEKFITAVQEGDGHLYGPVIQGYNREMVMGCGQSVEQLLELMSIEFHLATHAKNDQETMVGLSSAEQCTHCSKLGHCEDKCWIKHPDLKLERKKMQSKNEARKCFKCGKVGHLKRDCKHNSISSNRQNILASFNDNNTSSIDCYSRTYIDSASSCHTVASLKLLDKGTTQRTNITVKAVNGTIITLTHKGKRTINTSQGVITLGEVYYADGLKYNLMSVPTMAKLGVKVTLGNDEAYMEKYKRKIHLRKN